MNQIQYYMNLQADLSGSRSKNRFRMEMLWGISKMLELMEDSEDFIMIFDYVCDIEVHKEDSYQYYQIKTHKVGSAGYTPKKLVKFKEGQEGSVLGKLFALLPNDEDFVKVVLVCNVPFHKLSNSPGETSLDKLNFDDQQVLIDAIKQELGVKKVNLSKSFYLYTPMNLQSPEQEIKGKLITSFQKLKGSEPLNPNALYRLVFDCVKDRASYEFEITDYDELKRLKGISNIDLDKMLEAHCISEKTGVGETIRYIDGLTDIHAKRIYKRALPAIVSKIAKSRHMQDLEYKMAKELYKSSSKKMSFEEAIDYLTGFFHDEFPLEYSNEEKIVCYMLVINKYEEGGFDDEIGL